MWPLFLKPVTQLTSKASGNQAEKKAAAYLRKQGVHIVKRNFRCRQGEIDLIGLHQNILIFFEVRFRKSTYWGTPFETVTQKKQLKIQFTAQNYICAQPQYQYHLIRFDVIGINNSHIHWIKNAFEFNL